MQWEQEHLLMHSNHNILSVKFLTTIKCVVYTHNQMNVLSVMALVFV